MIYLRTNFLIQVKEINAWDRSLAVPLSGCFNSACGQAVAICKMSITEADLLTTSQYFANNLHTTRCYDNKSIPFSAFDKEGFAKIFMTDEGFKNKTETPGEMIHGGGVFRYNTVKSDQGLIAVPGDFTLLSTAFMYAMQRKGGFVDVHVNKDDMTSHIQYSQIRTSRPKSQSKLSVIK